MGTTALRGLSYVSELTDVQKEWLEIRKKCPGMSDDHFSHPNVLDDLKVAKSCLMRESDSLMMYLEMSIDENRVCQTCGNPSKTKCASCCEVYYCSRECQKSDWLEQKKSCCV